MPAGGSAVGVVLSEGRGGISVELSYVTLQVMGRVQLPLDTALMT